MLHIPHPAKLPRLCNQNRSLAFSGSNQSWVVAPAKQLRDGQDSHWNMSKNQRQAPLCFQVLVIQSKHIPSLIKHSFSNTWVFEKFYQSSALKILTWPQVLYATKKVKGSYLFTIKITAQYSSKYNPSIFWIKISWYNFLNAYCLDLPIDLLHQKPYRWSLGMCIVKAPQIIHIKSGGKGL